MFFFPIHLFAFVIILPRIPIAHLSLSLWLRSFIWLCRTYFRSPVNSYLNRSLSCLIITHYPCSRSAHHSPQTHIQPVHSHIAQVSFALRFARFPFLFLLWPNIVHSSPPFHSPSLFSPPGGDDPECVIALFCHISSFLCSWPFVLRFECIFDPLRLGFKVFSWRHLNLFISITF